MRERSAVDRTAADPPRRVPARASREAPGRRRGRPGASRTAADGAPEAGPPAVEDGAPVEDGFAEFARSRWGRLVRLAYSLTLDVGRAEDLVQESLAKLWAKWPQVRDGAPEAYVRQTIVNGAISASRRRWKGEEPHWDMPEPPVPRGPLESDAVDQRDWLRRGLADLSMLQRAVVVLRYAEDMSERQVAETLGISTGSVKTHAFRGLARLRATGHPDRTAAEEVRP
ncbi:MAG TPA: SigE family RNA polymerase sigma factor [Mycobacteriales bacterium]